MAMQVTHAFTSTAPQGVDATKVRTNDWNAQHTLTGTVDNTQLGSAAITGQTEDTAPATGDFLLTYDTSATALKKATIANVLTLSPAASSTVSGISELATIAEARTGTDTARAVTPEALSALWRQGASIASASTLAKPSDADLGGYHFITGSTTINNIWSGETNGTELDVLFGSSPTLVNSSTLVLPRGVNVAARAGDAARFRAETGSVWRCVSAPPHWYQADRIMVASKTADYTATVADSGTEIIFTAAGFTLNLPAVSGNEGLWYVVRSIGNGTTVIDPSGSETIDGLTTRNLRQNDCVIIMCSGTVWRTISGTYSYVSSQQTLTLGGLTTLAHGLGEEPDDVEYWYECTTNDLNYTGGTDKVQTFINAATGISSGITGYNDATNCNVRVGSVSAGSLLNKTTGAFAAITAANWRLRVIARVRIG